MRLRPSLMLLAAGLTALPAFAPLTAPSSASSVPAPVLASENVELAFTMPDAAGAFSTSFDPTRPLMYVNTVQGLSIYDTTDPEMPVLQSRVELPHFENEGMTVGQRADGTTFALIGIDLFAVDPLTGQRTTDGSSFYVIDVTDPTAGYVRSFTDVATSTHTISCIDAECMTAWTSGVYQGAKMTAIDLTDLSKPVVAKELTNINGPQGAQTGYGVHQWTHDSAGYVTGAGGVGTGIYDVSDPLNPVALNTTDKHGTMAPYNDFIQHNAERPNGAAMTAATTPEELAAQKAAAADGYSVAEGNVMIITEEDYDSPDCQGVAGVDAPEGGVSTWGIPYLSSSELVKDNPGLLGNGGTMEPLDTWNSELYDLGVPTPAGGLCSAHYFTTHQDGFVAQGWYQQGTRILDVRDATDIKQVGYFIGQVSETWHAYWAPERDANGHVTGESTNVLYTNDAARGVDVLVVDLPESGTAETDAIVAPILPQWLDISAAGAQSTGDASLGYMCRLGGTSRFAAPALATAKGILSR